MAAKRAHVTPQPRGGGGPSPAVTPTAPAAPADGSASRGFTVAGKHVSWDAVFMVAGLLGAFLLYRRSAGGSSSGTTVIQGSAPQQVQPGPQDSSAIGMPVAGNAAAGGGNWWDPLYNDLEHRQADPSGATYWAAETQAVGQAQATREFLATPEAQVQTDYQSILHRGADTGGLNFYAAELNSGAYTNAQIISQLQNSPEAKATVTHV